MTSVEKLEISLLGLISFDSEELRAKYKERIANAKEMEKQQQDDYAIEFAEWCLKIRFEPIENISVEKLLKIYKKEQFNK